jgi:hypothetical protein
VFSNKLKEQKSGDMSPLPPVSYVPLDASGATATEAAEEEAVEVSVSTVAATAVATPVTTC